MIQSMTAYGRAGNTGDWGNASCEIRSVNHRYLEIMIHLPKELRLLEQVIRETISRRLKRGKVDCTIRFEQPGAVNDSLSVNDALLGKLIETTETIHSKLKTVSTINVLEILRWPGVLNQDISEPAAISEPLVALVVQTLDAVVETRKREGERIKLMIAERCKLVKDNIDKIRAVSPAIIANQREKLKQRAQQFEIDLQHERLEQELLILSQKMDVAEELDRLDAHIDEVHCILNRQQADPVGRRLDFLMQEMNRESNTLGSKSLHLDPIRASIDLRVLIEQMREQFQNIE